MFKVSISGAPLRLSTANSFKSGSEIKTDAKLVGTNHHISAAS